jgi:hypothetical protein
MWQKPDSGSYVDLRARLRKKMQQNGLIKEKILAALQTTYEQALADAPVVLARSERERLFQQLLEDILTEVITENKTSHG